MTSSKWNLCPHKLSAQCGRTVMAEGKGEAVDGRTGQKFGGAEGETLSKCTKGLIYVYERFI